MKLVKVLCIASLLASCGNFDTYIKTSEKITNSKGLLISKLTEIISNDNHIYYISNEEMSWKEAYTFCKRNNLQLADYMRTIYNESMTEIVEDRPICNLHNMPRYKDFARRFIDRRKSCGVFSKLTLNDTKVWIYPAVDIRYSVVINLKNGNMSLEINEHDVFGLEEFIPHKALCEKKQVI